MWYYVGKHKCIKSYGGETQSKGPHGRPRRRRKNNIKLDLEEIACEGVDWTHLVYDRDNRRPFLTQLGIEGDRNGIYGLGRKLLVSHEGLRSMDLVRQSVTSLFIKQRA
jgi:hypothetical protein